MVKSIDEIKKELEDGAECSCCDGGCKTCADALALIRQLEADRDAAVDALKSNCVCTECKWFDDDLLEGHCNDCHSKNSSFEWRGVQKEE